MTPETVLTTGDVLATRRGAPKGIAGKASAAADGKGTRFYATETQIS